MFTGFLDISWRGPFTLCFLRGSGTSPILDFSRLGLKIIVLSRFTESHYCTYWWFYFNLRILFTCGFDHNIHEVLSWKSSRMISLLQTFYVRNKQINLDRSVDMRKNIDVSNNNYGLFFGTYPHWKYM